MLVPELDDELDEPPVPDELEPDPELELLPDSESEEPWLLLELSLSEAVSCVVEVVLVVELSLAMIWSASSMKLWKMIAG